MSSYHTEHIFRVEFRIEDLSTKPPTDHRLGKRGMTEALAHKILRSCPYGTNLVFALLCIVPWVPAPSALPLIFPFVAKTLNHLPRHERLVRLRHSLVYSERAETDIDRSPQSRAEDTDRKEHKRPTPSMKQELWTRLNKIGRTAKALLLLLPMPSQSLFWWLVLYLSSGRGNGKRHTSALIHCPRVVGSIESLVERQCGGGFLAFV